MDATYQTGSGVTVRTEFITNSRLLNTQDTKFRAIDSDWPILALSRDLGPIVLRTPWYSRWAYSGSCDSICRLQWGSAEVSLLLESVFVCWRCCTLTTLSVFGVFLMKSSVHLICRSSGSTSFWMISKVPFFGPRILTISSKIQRQRFHQTMLLSLPYPLHRLSVPWKHHSMNQIMEYERCPWVQSL